MTVYKGKTLYGASTIYGQHSTQEVILGKGSLETYNRLEIKRKFFSGYEDEWFDITKYLLKGAFVSREMDTNNFSYGQLRTSSAAIKVDNNGGAFLPPKVASSLFYGAISRHDTKVRYSSGYYDENRDKIEEVVFTGIFTAKGINTDFETGESTITALSYDGILSEVKTAESQFPGTSMTLKAIVADIMADTAITTFINYDAAQINPEINVAFDKPDEFNDMTVIDVFDRLARDSNSVWFIDIDTDTLIFRNRDINAGTPFAFIGGAVPGRTNIIEISNFDEGYGSLINYITYDTGSAKHIFQNSASVADYGVNPKDISGPEVTTFATIQSIASNIIEKFHFPKMRIHLKTAYMPNVLTFFDPVTVTYYAPTNAAVGLEILYFNRQDRHWNTGEFGLVFFNKLGSASEVTDSEVGENLSISGSPTYAANKFGNGIVVDAITEIIELTNTPATHDFAKGAIEIWIKMDANIVNGKPDDATKRRVVTWWKSATEYFQITFHDTLGLIWNLYDGVSNKAWNNTDAGLDITANTPAHIAFVWNKDGINGSSDKRRMYLNGVQVGSDTTSFVDVDMTTAEFYIGLLFNGSFLTGGAVNIDNIKWWDYDKLDYSDRNTADGRANPNFYNVVGSALGFVTPTNFLVAGWTHDTEKKFTNWILIEP